MEEARKGKRASQEEDNAFRSVFVELQESLYCDFVVMGYNVHFTLEKNQGGNSRQEYWKAIEFFNSQRSS